MESNYAGLGTSPPIDAFLATLDSADEKTGSAGPSRFGGPNCRGYSARRRSAPGWRHKHPVSAAETIWLMQLMVTYKGLLTSVAQDVTASTASLSLPGKTRLRPGACALYSSGARLHAGPVTSHP
jgi:hypothetical protein